MDTHYLTAVGARAIAERSSARLAQWHRGYTLSSVSDLASCPAFLLSGLLPIRLEPSLRRHPTVNLTLIWCNQPKQHTTKSRASKSRRCSRPPGRPWSKQPRLPSAIFRLLNGGMLVDSPGIVELESLAMKSMNHGCAREPYTYKIQCSGSRILDGCQFFASHHEEYAIFFRTFIAVSRIQANSLPLSRRG
ncbi:hypothetical protein BKA70DRAFT_1271697 [Coprinopsis sp. MPI-PUGE-AT-0042]|nr:hypothetical protein BKA70DRAFT_1271697 [Coprinopsis sp. MPI-PUGE-AT-0042]